MGSKSHFAEMLILGCVFLFASFNNIITASTDKESFVIEAVNSCRAQDSLTLIDFYNNTRGQDWTNKWDFNNPIDTWYGITLNAAGCVIGIDLDGETGGTISVSFGNNLSGFLPESVGNLRSLRKLIIGNNRIAGAVPARVFELPYIEIIDVFANEMIGPLPASMGNAANLEVLSMAGNNIGGSIPPSIGMLKKLKDLFIDNNRLTGILPPELGNASALRRIRLHNNMLSGSIPKELGLLSELTSINLAQNNLTGTLPPELGRLEKLLSFIIAHNQVTGVTPEEIGAMKSLRVLRLCNNNFIGPLPSRIGELGALEQFWANDNMLSGVIPTQIGNCKMMTDVRLNNNQLSGNIPEEIEELEFLVKLNLSNNLLIGPLPRNLEKLRRLQELQVSNNSLTGSLPEKIGELSSIKLIMADNNQIIGPLPSLVSHLQRFTQLVLNDNLIDGNIPEDYGNSVTLSKLDLRSNKLSGCFPESLLKKCDHDFSFDHNSELPWQGDFTQFCEGKTQINAKCSTESGVTDETIQPDCSCYSHVCIPSLITHDAYICGSESLTIGNTVYDTPGQVVDSLLTDNGCDSIITTNIIQVGINIETKDVTCFGGEDGSAEITTSISGLYDYTIYNQDNEEVASGQQVTAVPQLENSLAAGNYNLVLMETNIGCQIASQFEIGSTYSEIGETYENGVRCSGEELSINGHTYNSENPKGTEVLKTANGCDSLVIIDLEYIDYTVDVTDVSCDKDASGRILISADAPEDNYTFELYNLSQVIISESSTSFSFDTDYRLEPGTYQVEIRSAVLGCTYESTIEIISNFQSPEPTALDRVLCPGESLFINNNEYNEEKSFGTENLVSAQGCDSLVHVSLSYLETPTTRDDFIVTKSNSNKIDVLENDMLNFDTEVIISITDSKYVDEVRVNDRDEIEFVIDPNHSGLSTIEYEVCVEDCDLCQRALVTITTESDGFDEDVITPNNDGYNEVLVVSGYSEYETIPESSINIINRWGQVVYSTENYSNDWAGYKHGDTSSPLPEGVYYYHLLYSNGKSVMGSRSLIR